MLGSWRSWRGAFVEGRLTDDPLNNEIIFLTHNTCFPSPETDNAPSSPALSHPLHGFGILFLRGFYSSRFAMISKINVILSLQ